MLKMFIGNNFISNCNDNHSHINMAT
ncbi:conserved hypothetical protein [Klebsiella pneumoniae]|nr:conserved hypothetical protein [Klebsiella pneumoniae]